MEFPPPYEYDLQVHLQTSSHPHRQQSPLPLEALAESFVPVPADGQDDSPPQSQNVLFEPSVAGDDDLDFVPGLIPATTKAAFHGTDLIFNLGVEPKSKRLKERDVYENNSRVDSALLPLSLAEIEEGLPQQDEEMYRFINHEMEQLSPSILDKVHSSQILAVSFVGGRYLHKLRQKDAEIEILNERNKELGDRLKQLTDEVGAWRQHASYNENAISALHFLLMKVCARGEEEGCGDSEVNDAASYNIGSPYGTSLSLACRACGVSRACMEVDPCRHLCLCKDCEREPDFCPLCRTSKTKGFAVFLPRDKNGTKFNQSGVVVKRDFWTTLVVGPARFTVSTKPCPKTSDPIDFSRSIPAWMSSLGSPSGVEEKKSHYILVHYSIRTYVT